MPTFGQIFFVLVTSCWVYMVVSTIRTRHSERERQRVIRRVDATLTVWAQEWPDERIRGLLLAALRKHGAKV